MKEGDKVHYISPDNIKENGIIKSVNDYRKTAYVIYECKGDWENYQHYSGIQTKYEDLQLGWIAEHDNSTEPTHLSIEDEMINALKDTDTFLWDMRLYFSDGYPLVLHKRIKYILKQLTELGKTIQL